MRVRFMIVPPGGGEIDHVMFADVPALPRQGDYLYVARKEGYHVGAAYLVRRIWWQFTAQNDEEGTIRPSDDIGVEVEEVISGFATDEERAQLERQGCQVMEATAY